METIHFVDTTIRDGMKLGMRSINSALASLAGPSNPSCSV
jgi:hypothetical protein